MPKNKKPRTDGLVYSTDPHFKAEEEQHDEPTLPPSKQQLWVMIDRKQRAGKIVTLVSGYKGRMEDLETLGKKLKSHCGSGGSVKDSEILVQGDHREKLITYLRKEGYQVK
jgi:translation initiation factor 1